MNLRSSIAVALVVALGLMFAAVPAVDAAPQTEVSVQDRTFAWTGKSGDDANYRWSANIDNPSGRELNVRVTIEMLDADGAVVGSNSTDVMLTAMDSTSVEQSGALAFTIAETAMQYRITLAEIE